MRFPFFKTKAEAIPKRKSFVSAGTGYISEPTPEDVKSSPWKNGAALASIQWLQTAFAEAPLFAEEQLPDGSWSRVPNHPAQNLIDNPNPFYGIRQIWSGLVPSLKLFGCGYLVKSRDLNGKLRELHFVSSQDMKPVSLPDTFEYIDYFEYRPSGRKPTKYLPKDVVYIRTSIHPDNPILAINPMESILRELKTDTEAARYTQRVLEKNGTTLAISLKEADSFFDEDEADKVKRKIQNALTGENRGTPLVFSDPVEIVQIGSTPSELGLSNLASAAEQRICSVLGVNPMVLGLASGNESRTYSNFEEARSAAYESVILPIQAIIEDELNRSLGMEFSGRKVRFVFDNSDIRVLQQDEDNLHDRLRQDYQYGLISKGEFRQEVGMPVEDGDFGVFYSGPEILPSESPKVKMAKERLRKALDGTV